jgi:hypothetical protein
VAAVRDHNGQQLAYVYFEDETGRRSAAKLLSKDEARRIAVNIANFDSTRCEVPMMRLLRLMFAFVIIAVVLSMNIRASHAYQTGDSKWCAVTNKGAETMQWECEYDTSDDCAAAVAGTGGYCAINPFWTTASIV